MVDNLGRSFQAPNELALETQVDLKRAGVAELADALRSGRCGVFPRGGSNPPSGTTYPMRVTKFD